MQLYRIWNREANKSYIGKTRWTFNDRYAGGKWWKWSHSHHLKRAFERYGHDAFEVQILHEAVMTEAEASQLEKAYIKQYDSFVPNGYNLTEGGGGSNEPTNVKEYCLIDKDGNEYYVKNLSAFSRRNKLHYGAMLNMVSGMTSSSQGYAMVGTDTKDIYVKRQNEYRLENVNTAEIVTIPFRGLRKWCRETGVDNASLRRVIDKQTLLSDGWKLEGVIIPEGYGKHTKYEGVMLISPTGEEVVVDNVYRFAKDNDLDRGQLYDLINERSFSTKGWTLKERHANPIKMESKNKTWQIKDIKTGDVHEVRNLSRFCRERQLDVNSFFGMVDGRVKAYRGFALESTDLTDYAPPKKVSYIKLQHEDGRTVEATGPRVIEREHKLCSAQMLYQILAGKSMNLVKGWSIVTARYMDDAYPEANLIRGQIVQS